MKTLFFILLKIALLPIWFIIAILLSVGIIKLFGLEGQQLLIFVETLVCGAVSLFACVFLNDFIDECFDY